jgi:hypothetical protein
MWNLDHFRILFHKVFETAIMVLRSVEFEGYSELPLICDGGKTHCVAAFVKKGIHIVKSM